MTYAVVAISSFMATISMDQTVIPVLLAVISSGFVFGLFKVMPERRSILIQASENAVKVVNEAIGTLQRELTDARLEIARLEGELSTAREGRTKLEREVLELRGKIVRLETEIEIYSRLAGRGDMQDQARKEADEQISAREAEKDQSSHGE